MTDTSRMKEASWQIGGVNGAKKLRSVRHFVRPSSTRTRIGSLKVLGESSTAQKSLLFARCKAELENLEPKIKGSSNWRGVYLD